MSWKYSSLLAIILISSGCIAEKSESSRFMPGQKTNESLLEIAGQEPQVASFLSKNPDYHVEISVLTEETIMNLSKKSPAIYGKLPPKQLYTIEYNSGRGMLVIVDLENKKVLRYFRIADVTLE